MGIVSRLPIPSKLMNALLHHFINASLQEKALRELLKQLENDKFENDLTATETCAGSYIYRRPHIDGCNFFYAQREQKVGPRFYPRSFHGHPTNKSAPCREPQGPCVKD